MTQEELEHLLENVDWEPEVDPLWAEASGRRLVAYANRMEVHRRHVRHWRLALSSALAVVLVILWWTQTAPLRTAIHATGQLPDSVRLLQLTKENLPNIYAAGSWIGRAWDRAVAAVTPGARSAVAVNAQRDASTGLVRAGVRDTDGYVLVDPATGTVVGTVGDRLPQQARMVETAIPRFGTYEQARQIALQDPVIQARGYQATGIFAPTVYSMQGPGSLPEDGTAQRIIAVQLQRTGEATPALTALVDLSKRQVIQLVDSGAQLGLVVGDTAGTYAVPGDRAIGQLPPFSMEGKDGRL